MVLDKFIKVLFFFFFHLSTGESNTTHRAPPSNLVKVISRKSQAGMSINLPNHSRISSSLIITQFILIPSLNSNFTTTHYHILVPCCPQIVPYVDFKHSVTVP